MDYNCLCKLCLVICLRVWFYLVYLFGCWVAGILAMSLSLCCAGLGVALTFRFGDFDCVRWVCDC